MLFKYHKYSLDLLLMLQNLILQLAVRELHVQYGGIENTGENFQWDIQVFVRVSAFIHIK